jgi:NADH:ubiquinone oxidoreductase subunit K
LIPLSWFLAVSVFLFGLGIIMLVTQRNAIRMLMGIELILNAANLNFVAFSRYDAHLLQGQMMALLVMVVAACEMVVALAIIIRLYKFYKTTELNQINQVKEK